MDGLNTGFNDSLNDGLQMNAFSNLGTTTTAAPGATEAPAQPDFFGFPIPQGKTNPYTGDTVIDPWTAY